MRPFRPGWERVGCSDHHDSWMKSRDRPHKAATCTCQHALARARSRALESVAGELTAKRAATHEAGAVLKNAALRLLRDDESKKKAVA
jgi:hypothetical protein